MWRETGVGAVVHVIVPWSVASSQIPVSKISNLESTVLNQFLTHLQRELASLHQPAGCVGKLRVHGIDTRRQIIRRRREAYRDSGSRATRHQGTACGRDIEPKGSVAKRPVQR